MLTKRTVLATAMAAGLTSSLGRVAPAQTKDVTVRIIPGVSHSLLPDPGGLSSGWAALPAFLTSPEILDELTRWSSARLAPHTP